MEGAGLKKKYSLKEEDSYDVQKIKSLISPYKGICKFTLKRSFTDFHKSKEDAFLDEIFIKSDETEHQHTYLFKKGNWVVSERKYKLYFRGKNKIYLQQWCDCNEIIQTGKNKNATNIMGCWENIETEK